MTMHPKSCCCRKEGCGEDIKPAVYLYFDVGPHRQGSRGNGEPYTARLAEDFLTRYNFVDSISYGLAYQLDEDDIPDSYYGNPGGSDSGTEDTPRGAKLRADREAPTLIERMFNGKGMLSTSIEDPCSPFCLQDEDIIHPKINASKYGIDNEFVGGDGKVRVGLEVDLFRVDSNSPQTFATYPFIGELVQTNCEGDNPLQCFNGEYEFDPSLLPPLDDDFLGGCLWLNNTYIHGKLHGNGPFDVGDDPDDVSEFTGENPADWGYPDMYTESDQETFYHSNQYSCDEFNYAKSWNRGNEPGGADRPLRTDVGGVPKRWQQTWHYWDGVVGNNYRNRTICNGWENNLYGDLSPCDSACNRIYPSCFELPIERINYKSRDVSGYGSALEYDNVAQKLHELIVKRFGPQILENGTVNPYPSQIYYQGAEKGRGSDLCDDNPLLGNPEIESSREGYWKIIKDLYDIMVESWGEEVATAKFNPCYFDFDTETGRANIEESNLLDGINFCSGHACRNKNGDLPHVYDRDMTSPGTPYDDSSVPMMCKALHNISNTERKRACCIDGVCSDETKENCKSLGGSWNRFNKCIDDVDCSKGVCCWGCGQQMHYNYAKDIMEMPYDYMIESESLASDTASKYNNGVRHNFYSETSDNEFQLIQTNWARPVACELVTEEECIHKKAIVKKYTFIERDGHWEGCQDWPVKSGENDNKYQIVVTDAIWENDCPYDIGVGNPIDDPFQPCLADWRDPWNRWGCSAREIGEESSGWWLGHGTKIHPTFTAYNSSECNKQSEYRPTSEYQYTDVSSMFVDSFESMFKNKMENMPYIPEAVASRGAWIFAPAGSATDYNNRFTMLGVCTTSSESFISSSHECTIRDGFWNPLEEWWNTESGNEIEVGSLAMTCPILLKGINLQGGDVCESGDDFPLSMCYQRQNPIEPWELGNFTYNNKHSGGFYYFNRRSWGSDTDSASKYYHSTVMFNKMATAHHKCCNGDPEKVQSCNWPKNQYNPAFWECSSETVNPAGEDGCGWGSGAKSWPKRYEYESPIDYTPIDDLTVTPWIKDYFTSYYYSTPPSNSLYTDVFDNYIDVRKPKFNLAYSVYNLSGPNSLKSWTNYIPGLIGPNSNPYLGSVEDLEYDNYCVGYGIAPNYNIFDYHHCAWYGEHADRFIDDERFFDYELNNEDHMEMTQVPKFTGDPRLILPTDFWDYGYASVIHNYTQFDFMITFQDLWWTNISQNVPWDQGSASWMGLADQTWHQHPWGDSLSENSNYERSYEDRSPYHKLGTKQLVTYIQNLHQPCYVSSTEPSYHNPMNWEIFNQLPVSVNENITGQEQPAKRGMQGNFRGNDPDWQYSNTQMLPLSDHAHWKQGLRNVNQIGMYEGTYGYEFNYGDDGPDDGSTQFNSAVGNNGAQGFYPEVSQYTCDRVGACCLEDSKYRNPEIMNSCMEIKWSDCKKLGGIFMGPQVRCSDYGGVCDKGACCLGHAAFFDVPWENDSSPSSGADYIENKYFPGVNFATKNDTCFNTVRGLCHIRGYFGTQMGSFDGDEFWPLSKYDNQNTPHFGHFYEGLGCSDLKCNCWSPKYNISTRYVDDEAEYPSKWNWHHPWGGGFDYDEPRSPLSSPMGHRGWFMNSLPGISIDLRTSYNKQGDLGESFWEIGDGFGGDFQTDLGVLLLGQDDEQLGYSCNPNPGIPLWNGDATPCCCDPRWGHMCDVDNGELNGWTDGFASDVHCKFSGALGACCREDGSCRPNNTKGQCESHPGSEWLGEKTVCTYNSCDFLTDVPEDLGACCCSDGASWSNCFDGVTKQRCEFWDFSIDYVKPENAGNGGCFYYPEQKCVESVNGFLKCPDTSIFGDLDDPNQFPPRIV